MPPAWSARDCRAAVSGLSGALFLLPAAATPLRWEKRLWFATATLSVLADYVCIPFPHPVHGIDRVAHARVEVSRQDTFSRLRRGHRDPLSAQVATAQVARLAIRVPAMFPLGAVPVATYAFAQRQKRLDRPAAWRAAHGLWHLTGAAVAVAATARLRGVPR